MSSPDPYSQPTHRRSLSNASSPSTSILAPPARDPRAPQSHGVPIPRPPSQIHRPMNNNPSEGNTPLSHSPSSSDSPFPFSPINSTNPASFLSTNTGVTTPPSSASLNSNPPGLYSASSMRTLSYPSVPPPSLSSSFGSPTIPYHLPRRDPSLSPIEPLSRRNSITNRRGSFDRRVAETGNLRSLSHSRRASIERGGRVAETGTLIRSRAGSQSLSSTSEAPPLAEEKDSADEINAGSVEVS